MDEKTIISAFNKVFGLPFADDSDCSPGVKVSYNPSVRAFTLEESFMLSLNEVLEALDD